MPPSSPSTLIRQITLPSLIAAHGRVHGDKPLFIEGDATMTWRQFDRTTNRIANGLWRMGKRKGERIGLLAFNTIFAYCAFFGIVRAGAVAAPLSFLLAPDAILRLIEDAQIRLLFVGKGFEELAKALAAQSGDLTLIHEDEADRLFARDSGDAPPIHPSLDDPYNVIYSSGTTGVPKGIVHSHMARFWMANNMETAFRANASSKLIVTTPPFSNGTNICLLPALFHGATCILMRGFDPKAFCDIVARHRPTHAFMVPTQYQGIVDCPDAEHVDWSCFVALITGGAPMPKQLRQRVIEMAGERLFELWGLTEGVGTYIFPEEMAGHAGSVGRVPPGVDLRLIDQDGREAASGEAGEIVGRSPMVMDGYFNRDDANAEAQWVAADGTVYLRTGDIGQFDADGFLWIRGRSKDMIISGGLNVYPADIEAVLIEHPLVSDSTVFGIAHPKWGETPVGYYIAAPGGETAAEEIREWANARLSKTQRLQELRPHTGDFPRNALGKVLKGQLAERFERETN